MLKYLKLSTIDASREASLGLNFVAFDLSIFNMDGRKWYQSKNQWKRKVFRYNNR